MTLISEKDRQEIQKILGRMQAPVKLVHFTQTVNCETCDDTRRLLEEVAPLSDKLSLEVFNFTLDKEKVDEYGIDKFPATVVEGEGSRRVRFYGIPAGYEIVSLLDAIVLASAGDSDLAPESRTQLASVKDPLHLEVLVTPT